MLFLLTKKPKLKYPLSTLSEAVTPIGPQPLSPVMRGRRVGTRSASKRNVRVDVTTDLSTERGTLATPPHPLGPPPVAFAPE